MNTPTLLGYLGLLASSPLIVLGLHAITIRFIRFLKAPQVVAAFAVIGGYPIVAIAAWEVSLRHLPWGLELGIAWFYGILVYGGFSYAYFHLFNLGETSRRFRILCELKVRGPLNRDEIDIRYSPRIMLRTRLERLLAARQLRQVNGRYVLESRLLYYVSQVIALWARLLRLPMEKNA